MFFSHFQFISFDKTSLSFFTVIITQTLKSMTSKDTSRFIFLQSQLSEQSLFQDLQLFHETLVYIPLFFILPLF